VPSIYVLVARTHVADEAAEKEPEPGPEGTVLTPAT